MAYQAAPTVFKKPIPEPKVNPFPAGSPANPTPTIGSAPPTPSQLPDTSKLAPNGNMQTSTVVNPQNTPDVQNKQMIDISVGGKTFRMTQAEHDALTGISGGQLPAQYQEIQNLQRYQRIKSQKFNELLNAAEGTRATNELLTNQPNNTSQALNTPIDQQIANKEGAFAATEAGKAPLGFVAGTVLDVLTKPKALQQTATSAFQIAAAANEYLPEFLQLPFSKRKTPEVVKAETSFTDASKTLNDNIDMVKLGLKDANDVQKEIDDATDAILTLESTTKGLGKLSGRYWIDQGAEIEMSIANEKATLEQQRIKLLAAEQDARMLDARANFGQ